MQPTQLQPKINALMAAKDYMERAQAALRIEGYNKYNNEYKALTTAIDGLRADILGLQTGQFPYIKVAEHGKS